MLAGASCQLPAGAPLVHPLHCFLSRNNLIAYSDNHSYPKYTPKETPRQSARPARRVRCVSLISSGLAIALGVPRSAILAFAVVAVVLRWFQGLAVPAAIRIGTERRTIVAVRDRSGSLARGCVPPTLGGLAGLYQDEYT